MYLCHTRLHPAFIPRFAYFTHACAQPAKALGKRGHRIFLEVVQRRRRTGLIVLLPGIWLAAEAAVFSALIRRDAVRSVGVLLAHLGEVGFVLHFLTRHGVGAESGGARALEACVVASCLSQWCLASASGCAGASAQGRAHAGCRCIVLLR